MTPEEVEARWKRIEACMELAAKHLASAGERLERSAKSRSLLDEKVARLQEDVRRLEWKMRGPGKDGA